MNFRITLIPLVLGAVIALPAHAFDIVHEKTSYLDSKYVTLGIGLGVAGLMNESGVQGDTGFGVRITAGHHFSRYWQAELSYQFSFFDLRSPDPINPTQLLRSGAQMNQVVLRGILLYPAVMMQPYLSAGVGGYDLFGVAQRTALRFPMNFQIPIAAGVQGYIYKNMISFDAEFSYQFLLGENQPQDILTVLGLNRVRFDAYSVMMSFTFHLF